MDSSSKCLDIKILSSVDRHHLDVKILGSL